MHTVVETFFENLPKLKTSILLIFFRNNLQNCTLIAFIKHCTYIM